METRTCRKCGREKPLTAENFRPHGCGRSGFRWECRLCIQAARASIDEVCSIEGCSKRAREAGICGMHAQRIRRHGDPQRGRLEAEWRANNRKAQLSRLTGDETCYPKFLGRHEHRQVAARMLGRPLKKGEIVHHIDGDKRNNDPSNLQVMTQADHIALHRVQLLAARKEKAGY